MHPVYLTLAGDDIEDDLERLNRAVRMEQERGTGNSALHLLSETATIPGAWRKMVLMLNKSGHLINMRNKMGQTPLCRAAARGNAELVQALLEEGADWMMMDHDGISALERALEKPDSETAQVMIAWIRRQELGKLARGREDTETSGQGEALL